MAKNPTLNEIQYFGKSYPKRRWLLPAVLLPLIFLLITSLVQAQNKASIKGTVVDSITGLPVEKATVAILYAKDSTLISYTLSAKDGQFAVYRMPLNTALLVNISHISYNTYNRAVRAATEQAVDLGRIRLTVGQELEEVVVEGRPPIRMNKDTITFNADAFKVRPNAVIEDLLKKLPGVQVDLDGTVSVNGKQISKILLDNKEFFSNDISILTKNFDAALIDEIQVMDDKGRNPDLIQDETNLPKIMNLKLKHAIKRSSFGKFYAGTGTSSRYEAGALVNYFRDTLQASFIGFSNNINRAAFDNSELQNQGGFNRSGTSSLYGGNLNLGGRVYGAIQRATSAGINLNNNWAERRKANLMYFYGDNKNRSENSSYSRQFLDQTTLSGLSDSKNINRRFNHNITGLLEWEIDSMTNFRYAPRASFSDSRSDANTSGSSRNELDELINDNKNETNGSASAPTFSHDFNFYRRLWKKGESISIFHSLQINDSQNRNANLTAINFYDQSGRSNLLNQQIVKKNEQTDLTAGLQYQYPFSDKFSITIGAHGRREQYAENLGTFNFNEASGQYDLFLDRLSSDLSRTIHEYQFNPGMSWRPSQKINMQLGLNSFWQRVSNHFGTAYPQLQTNKHYWLPKFTVTAYRINLSYNVRIQQPTIGQLSPITNDANPLYISSGNPNLKPSRNHDITLNYSTYFQNQQVSFFIYSSAQIIENAASSQATVNATDGSRTSIPVNVDGNYYGYLSSSLNKRFKKMGNWTTQLMLSLNTNVNGNTYLLNEAENKQRSVQMSVAPGFYVDWKNLLSIQPLYNFSWQFNRNTQQSTGNNPSANPTIFNQNLSALISLKWPQKVNWEISYTYQNNGQVSGNFNSKANLINASVGIMMLKKDRGELRVKVYDLLDQNNGFQSYAYDNSLVDYNMLVLKRYFLLSYVFKFNHVVNK